MEKYLWARIKKIKSLSIRRLATVKLSEPPDKPGPLTFAPSQCTRSCWELGAEPLHASELEMPRGDPTVTCLTSAVTRDAAEGRQRQLSEQQWSPGWLDCMILTVFLTPILCTPILPARKEGTVPSLRKRATRTPAVWLTASKLHWAL